TKIIALVLTIALITVLLMQSYNIYNAFSQNKISLKQTEELMNKDYNTNIRNQVEAVISLININDKILQSQGMGIEERKQAIKEQIREIRYEKTGYFWIDTFDGVNVLLPPNPAAEGKNRYELQDVNGKYMIKEIIANGKKAEGGYTDYWFPKPGEKDASPKRGYSLSFEKYQWVVGTGNYIDDIDKAVSARKNELNDAFLKSIVLTGVILFIVLIFTIAGSVLIANSLANPVKYSSSFIEKITTGNLTEEVSPVFMKQNDEIGSMLKAISQFEKKLNEVLGEINFAAIQLSSTSEQTSTTSLNFSDSSQRQAASVEEINAVIEEVSSNVDMITENTNNQFSNVNLLMESVEKLKFIEKNILDKSQTIIEFSNVIRGRSDESTKSLKMMQSEFEAINESSQKMMEMVNLINGIADQINLLSLNAAIESARAGDAGRGFAVVADEISKLADATSSNVKQIQETIKVNDDKIKEGTKIVFESLSKQENVIKGIKDISDSIIQVSENISEQSVVTDQVDRESRSVKEKSEQIVLAIEEQKIAFSEISSSISVINQETQANAGGAEEIASSSEQVAAMAHTMLEKISFFKLRKQEFEGHNT
ncbi:MAG: methyl-accepting chemotaxis protein, partial [Spirochaetes bacterium]|nr:methyl-accepting chemotaxis protein [Spirochaetota bacterium]